MKKLITFYKKYISIFVISALPLGILAAKYIPWFVKIADGAISKLIDGISFLAPVAIFLILAPSIGQMIRARKESGFGGFVIFWFGLTRVIAGIWACIFTSLILGLPLLPKQNSIHFSTIFYQQLIVLKDLLFKSVFFWAIWISIIVGVYAYYNKNIHSFLKRGSGAIENFGNYIEPWIPLLMFVLGGYIYSLPQTLNHSLSSETVSSLSVLGFGKLNIFGLSLDISREFGLVWIYILGALLIGLGCFIWQGLQLCILRKYVANPFSIRKYFKEYWIKVYPLAWSTSSESISMPLNMSLIKDKFSYVSEVVRKLVVGLGGYLNINGTTMHVILLAGIVSVLVGYKPSFLQLLLGVPLIALIGYGVPGIPGELVLFAIPMVKILNLPEPIIPLFMALYLALQIGLPDSFRTGANVTDNGIYAIGLNKLYNNRFKDRDGVQVEQKVELVETIKYPELEPAELLQAQEAKEAQLQEAAQSQKVTQSQEVKGG